MGIKAIFESINTKKIKIHQGTLIMLIRPVLICSVIFIVLGIFLQFYKPVLVTDNFMGELLNRNDLILVSTQAFKSRDIRFGDVILHDARAETDDGETHQYINRVIGMPGDEIEIKDEYVVRNGVSMEEPYVPGGRTNGEMEKITVPEGCYFVLGDNRFFSIDSRDERVGFVTKGQVQGKVVRRVLPASRAGDISLE